MHALLISSPENHHHRERRIHDVGNFPAPGPGIELRAGVRPVEDLRFSAYSARTFFAFRFSFFLRDVIEVRPGKIFFQKKGKQSAADAKDIHVKQQRTKSTRQNSARASSEMAVKRGGRSTPFFATNYYVFGILKYLFRRGQTKNVKPNVVITSR